MSKLAFYRKHTIIIHISFDHKLKFCLHFYSFKQNIFWNAWIGGKNWHSENIHSSISKKWLGQNITHSHSVGRKYKRKGEIFREKAASKEYMALQRPHSFPKEEELQLSHTKCVTFYDVLNATFLWQGTT